MFIASFVDQHQIDWSPFSKTKEWAKSRVF